MISTPDVDSVSNPLTERFLEDRNLSWELKLIAIEDINIDASHHNQARISPVDPALVERYEQSELAGATFPAIIVGTNGRRSSYVIADGIHRVAAKYKAKRAMVWAYVFDYQTDDEFRSVSRTANAILNGRDNTEEERLMHAAAFIARGVDRKVAAVQCGVSVSRIGTYITAQTARQRFNALGIGIKQYADISDKSISDLSAVTTDGAVRKALEMVKYGIPHHLLVKSLRDARDSAVTEQARVDAQISAMSAIADVQSGRAIGLIKGRKDTVRMRILGAQKVVAEINKSGRREEFADDLARLAEACLEPQIT